MNVLLIVVCHFALFLLAIVLSVLLRYTDSDCPFGIFKLFLCYFFVTSSHYQTILPDLAHDKYIFTSRNQNIFVLSNLLVVNVIINGKLFSFQ